jgi:hypothetical protein
MSDRTANYDRAAREIEREAEVRGDLDQCTVDALARHLRSVAAELTESHASRDARREAARGDAAAVDAVTRAH